MWNLSRYGHATAAKTGDGPETSYHTLLDYGHHLVAHIQQRCLVIQLCHNTLGSLVGYVAFLNHHIVPLMLPSELDDTLLQNFLHTYKPSYLYLPDHMAQKFPHYTYVYSNLGYVLLKTNDTNTYLLHDELALLLTTSGSTGSPKLVRQSYKNIQSNTKSIVEYLNLNETERTITTLPMNYTYGLSILNTHLAVGASIILTEMGLMQKEFWHYLKEYKVTSFGGVPYTYAMLEKLRFFNMELPHLRYMTQAGGKLSPDLHQKFAAYAQKNNKSFIVMYGQTEATARMSYLPPEKSLDKYGSIGIAIPGGKLYLVNANGQEIVATETEGELVYSGDNVTLGYAECGDDLARGDERNNQLFTGDIATMDSEGYYYIVGRKNRFIKIFGNRVNLDETEKLIQTHFNHDVECACTGVDDAMLIYITNPIIEKEVKDFVSKKTGLNPIAFKVLVTDYIPKNEAGKPIYTELRNKNGVI